MSDRLMSSDPDFEQNAARDRVNGTAGLNSTGTQNNAPPNGGGNPSGRSGDAPFGLGAGKPVTYNPYQATAAPGSMKTDLGPAAQSASVNGIDPRANGYNQGLAAQFWAQAQGKGPSLAQMQLQQGTDQSMRQQAALAASGRNPAMSSYNAMQNQAGQAQQLAGQSAMARLQEQYQAQAGLAGLTNQMQNAYGQNAAMGQQNNQFNAGAQNQMASQQGQLNQDTLKFYNELMAGQQGQYNQYQQQKDLQHDAYNYQLRNGVVGKGADAVAGAANGASGGGATAAASDQRLKQNFANGSAQMDSFFSQLQAQGQQSAGGSMDLNKQGAAGQGGQAVGKALRGALSGQNAPGAATAMSDKNAKQDIKPGGSNTASFLDKLKAQEYEYKDPSGPGQAPGRHISVMAQDLEKAGPVGQSMVQNTPHGKMVDYARGLATMLAAQSDLHHRLKKLEGTKGAPAPSEEK